MNRFKAQLESVKLNRSRTNMNRENYPYTMYGIRNFESRAFNVNEDDIDPNYYKVSLNLKKLKNDRTIAHGKNDESN